MAPPFLLYVLKINKISLWKVKICRTVGGGDLFLVICSRDGQTCILKLLDNLFILANLTCDGASCIFRLLGNFFITPNPTCDG